MDSQHYSPSSALESGFAVGDDFQFAKEAAAIARLAAVHDARERDGRCWPMVVG